MFRTVAQGPQGKSSLTTGLDLEMLQRTFTTSQAQMAPPNSHRDHQHHQRFHHQMPRAVTGRPPPIPRFDDMFNDADDIDNDDLLTEALDEPISEMPSASTADLRHIKRSISVGGVRLGPGSMTARVDSAAAYASAAAAAAGLLTFENENGIQADRQQPHLMHDSSSSRALSPLSSDAYIRAQASNGQQQGQQHFRPRNTAYSSLPPSPGNRATMTTGHQLKDMQSLQSALALKSSELDLENDLFHLPPNQGPVSRMSTVPAPTAVALQPSRIKVVVRKRPLNKKERNRSEYDVILVGKPNRLTVEEPKQKVDLTKYIERHDFNFDAVFDEEVSNDEVYQQTIGPIVPIIFDKTKATCFAYGQTGSGKTFTMQPLPIRAAEDFLYMLSDPKRVASGLQLWISFFEIYGGKLFDLLHDRNKLQMREDGKQQVCIVGLQEVHVSSVEAVRELIVRGNTSRSTGSTGANESSSRSHAILQMAIKEPAKAERSSSTTARARRPRQSIGSTSDAMKEDAPKTSLVGKLSFIDLAGSERGADTTDNDKQTRLEGAEINKSLLALKECIRALGAEQNHIPFRGSKLTEVLRDSFVGKSCTVMLSCISPGSLSVEHTLNTLRYTERVKALPRSGSGAVQGMMTSKRESSTNSSKPIPAAVSFTGLTGGQACGNDENEPNLPQAVVPPQHISAGYQQTVHTASFAAAGGGSYENQSVMMESMLGHGHNGLFDGALVHQRQLTIGASTGPVIRQDGITQTQAGSAAARSRPGAPRSGWRDRTPERVNSMTGAFTSSVPLFDQIAGQVDDANREEGLHSGVVTGEAYMQGLFSGIPPQKQVSGAGVMSQGQAPGAPSSGSLQPGLGLPGGAGDIAVFNSSTGSAANRQQWRVGTAGLLHPSNRAPPSPIRRPVSPNLTGRPAAAQIVDFARMTNQTTWSNRAAAPSPDTLGATDVPNDTISEQKNIPETPSSGSAEVISDEKGLSFPKWSFGAKKESSGNRTSSNSTNSSSSGEIDRESLSNKYIGTSQVDGHRLAPSLEVDTSSLPSGEENDADNEPHIQGKCCAPVDVEKASTTEIGSPASVGASVDVLKPVASAMNHTVAPKCSQQAQAKDKRNNGQAEEREEGKLESEAGTLKAFTGTPTRAKNGKQAPKRSTAGSAARQKTNGTASGILNFLSGTTPESTSKGSHDTSVSRATPVANANGDPSTSVVAAQPVAYRTRNGSRARNSSVAAPVQVVPDAAEKARGRCSVAEAAKRGKGKPNMPGLADASTEPTAPTSGSSELVQAEEPSKGTDSCNSSPDVDSSPLPDIQELVILHRQSIREVQASVQQEIVLLDQFEQGQCTFSEYTARLKAVHRDRMLASDALRAFLLK